MISLRTHTNWDSKNTFLEDYLVGEGIISETEILDEKKLLEFGLLSFLIYNFLHKRNYYIKNFENGSTRPFFSMYILGLKERPRTILLMHTSKDRFLSPYKELCVYDPFDDLETGSGEHNGCTIKPLINYNKSYLENRGKPITISTIKLTDQCKYHKDKLRKFFYDNPDFSSLLGGWALTFDCDYKLFMGIELEEDSNYDSIFNTFLALYFKRKLHYDKSYYNTNLLSPFKSHEVDACIISNENLIMFETSVEVNLKIDNLKNKMYNLLTLNKIYKNASTIYLTFGDKKGMNLTFTEFINDTPENGCFFRILNFPEFFKNMENDLENLDKQELLESFAEFLTEIEEILNK